MSNGSPLFNPELAIALQWGQFQARFFGQIAHELRAPLGTIMGLQQLILANLCESPAEERAFVAESYVASQRLLELLDLAIAVSKIDYAHDTAAPQCFDLREMLGDLAALLTIKAQNQNLTLTIKHPGETLEILGDRYHLRQLFLTLLNTTIQWTETGKIHLTYGFQQNQIIFQLTSSQTQDFWTETTLPNLTLGDRPSLEEVQKLAQSFEFSPALKWQLCQKLLGSFGGTLSRQHQDQTLQVMGQLPRLYR
ncbi:MAG: HAMP domain-containing sensor histidine kinase [Synechococcus sp.]|nr:HAMP domain-containing sensor histidine kinase [Synechococcus sp.]